MICIVCGIDISDQLEYWVHAFQKHPRSKELLSDPEFISVAGDSVYRTILEEYYSADDEGKVAIYHQLKERLCDLT